MTREVGVFAGDQVHFSRSQRVVAAGNVAIRVIGQEKVGRETILLRFSAIYMTWASGRDMDLPSKMARETSRGVSIVCPRRL